MPQRSEPHYPNAIDGNTFRDGVEFQDFVVKELSRRGIVIQLYASKRYQLQIGESLTGAEIKLDRRCTDTGRLSIEIAEKSRADIASWTPSGIMRADNAWLYVQGNHQVLFGFSRRFLVNYFYAKKPAVHDEPTIRKFYLSLADAKKYAAFDFDLRGAA